MANHIYRQSRLKQIRSIRDQTKIPATDLCCKYTATRVPCHSNLSLCHVPLGISTLAVPDTPALWVLNEVLIFKGAES